MDGLRLLNTILLGGGTTQAIQTLAGPQGFNILDKPHLMTLEIHIMKCAIYVTYTTVHTKICFEHYWLLEYSYIMYVNLFTGVHLVVSLGWGINDLHIL